VNEVYYSDGGNYTLDTSSPHVQLDGGTTLAVGAGASIVGTPGSPDAVIPSARSNDRAWGIVASGAGTNLSVTGGSISGSVVYEAGVGFGAGGGLYVRDSAVATIPGGSFEGCGDLGLGGAGWFALWVYGGTVAITGGTFVGGATASTLPGRSDGAAVNIGEGSIDISGGAFTPGAGGRYSVYFVRLNGGSLTISGGSFGGDIGVGEGNGVLKIQGSGLSFSAGRVTGTLSDGVAIDVAVEGFPEPNPSVSTPTLIQFG
jgi:hypothetical protein